MEKNLTSGSVFKNIVFFSLPYLLSYFLQTLYGMADLFIIGQFEGVDSITAVSVGSQVMHMLTVMIVGLAMGSTVVIGKAVGARKKQETASVIGNTVTLFMAVALVSTVLLLVFVDPIVAVMSTPGEAVSGTVRYLTILWEYLLLLPIILSAPFSVEWAIPKVPCILLQWPAALILCWTMCLLEHVIWDHPALPWELCCPRPSV